MQIDFALRILERSLNPVLVLDVSGLHLSMMSEGEIWEEKTGL